MRSAIVGTVLLFAAPAVAATYVAPVHVVPAVHVAPVVRTNPGVHSNSTIKPGTKGGTHTRTITVVTDTPTTKKCADKKSAKDCQKK